MARKTFNEKLNDSKNMPEVEELTSPEAIMRYGGSRMLIAPPLAYDALMKQIPAGKVLTSTQIRAYLAKQNQADFTCPLTAGIFINIAAWASDERNGENPTPYHRTLKKDGELNEKYPGGIDGQRQLLEQEGHVIRQKGKRCFVENYADCEIQL